MASLPLRFNFILKLGLLCSFFLIGYSKTATAQYNHRDSIVNAPMLGVSYAFQLPAGDLKKRFGYNSSAGFHFMNKTKKNWIFGVDYTFTFSPQSQVKETFSLFDSISSPSGNVIDANGEYSTILFYERGWTASVKFGKLISLPLPGQNKNSGVCFITSVGFMQHKIRIEDKYNRAPQLTKPYRKGYDRLTNGLMVSEFIGYLFLGNNRLLNFYGGVEVMAGFTQNRRTINFDTMQNDPTKRIDVYFGPRIGFILPLYKKEPNDFYYN